MSKKIKSRKHLNFIRSLECRVCGNNVDVIAHHLRSKGGTGYKPGDNWTISLCTPHHSTDFSTGIHRIGEKQFCEAHGIDAEYEAEKIWEHTGDAEWCLQFIEARRLANSEKSNGQ